MKNETVVVALDGAICTKEIDITRCLPKAGVVMALKKLIDHGNFVVISSDRPFHQARFTKEWLRMHHIPYDLIQFGKPVGFLHIGAREYRFKGWDSFMTEIYEPFKNTYTSDPISVYERALITNLKSMISEGRCSMIQIKNSMKQARKVASA